MKRTDTDQPLTADDVAERLDKAMLRVVRIMYDTRQMPGDLMEQVKASRYRTNIGNMLAAELATWGIEPRTPDDVTTWARAIGDAP